MGDYSKNKKFLIIIIVLIFQFGLLLFFKLYFFQRFSQEVMSENNENINNGTILYNSTNEMTNIINEAINYNNTNIAKNNSDAIMNNSFDLGSNI
jgi:flagellar basal body-associated protein FliL